MSFHVKAFLVRKPGMSAEDFRAHYEERHAPLARATFPEIVDHRRHYGAGGSQHFADGVAMPEWDAVTDITFADRAGFEAMIARLSTPAGASVAEDELRFLDRERCGMIVFGESAPQA